MILQECGISCYWNYHVRNKTQEDINEDFPFSGCITKVSVIDLWISLEMFNECIFSLIILYEILAQSNKTSMQLQWEYLSDDKRHVESMSDMFTGFVFIFMCKKKKKIFLAQ